MQTTTGTINPALLRLLKHLSRIIMPRNDASGLGDVSGPLAWRAVLSSAADGYQMSSSVAHKRRCKCSEICALYFSPSFCRARSSPDVYKRLLCFGMRSSCVVVSVWAAWPLAACERGIPKVGER